MSTLSSATASESIRSDYLSLLITQLRNQNPLEPLDNNQMSMQLAQLSQLEQLENISSTFQSVLLAEQAHQAAGLIGKQVTFVDPEADAQRSGRVEGVRLREGEVCLVVGGQTVNIGEIESISD